MIANKKALIALEAGLPSRRDSEIDIEADENKDSVEVLEEQQQHGGGGLGSACICGVIFAVLIGVGLLVFAIWAAVHYGSKKHHHHGHGSGTNTNVAGPGTVLAHCGNAELQRQSLMVGAALEQVPNIKYKDITTKCVNGSTAAFLLHCNAGYDVVAVGVDESGKSNTLGVVKNLVDGMDMEYNAKCQDSATSEKTSEGWEIKYLPEGSNEPQTHCIVQKTPTWKAMPQCLEHKAPTTGCDIEDEKFSSKHMKIDEPCDGKTGTECTVECDCPNPDGDDCWVQQGADTHEHTVKCGDDRNWKTETDLPTCVKKQPAKSCNVEDEGARLKKKHMLIMETFDAKCDGKAGTECTVGWELGVFYPHAGVAPKNYICFFFPKNFILLILISFSSKKPGY